MGRAPLQSTRRTPQNPIGMLAMSSVCPMQSRFALVHFFKFYKSEEFAWTVCTLVKLVNDSECMICVARERK